MKKSEIIPDFPRTQHLPYKANAGRSDLIADTQDCLFIFTEPNVYVEEKVDGANCAIVIYEGHPIIKNRNNFISKAQGRARTPAKMQFSSIYNWFYQNREKFENLYEKLGFPVVVYGEWMFALHGIRYDKLPSYFIAFDLYDYSREKYLPTPLAREALKESGFCVTPLLYSGALDKWEQLDEFCSELSPFSSIDIREGIYLKVANNEEVTHRFKMVRHDFIQGCHWNKKMLKKNNLQK